MADGQEGGTVAGDRVARDAIRLLKLLEEVVSCPMAASWLEAQSGIHGRALTAIAEVGPRVRTAADAGRH